MKFKKALKHLIEGGRVYRESWDSVCYIEFVGELVKFSTPELNVYVDYILGVEDLQAEDWKVLHGHF